jgi:hypothetical protein
MFQGIAGPDQEKESAKDASKSNSTDSIVTRVHGVDRMDTSVLGKQKVLFVQTFVVYCTWDCPELL